MPEPEFTIDTLRTLDTGVVIAYEGAPEPAMRTRRGRNAFYTFWWVKQGAAELEIDGRSYRYGAGEWVLIPAMTDRYHALDESTELVSLSFQWDWPLGEPVLRIEEPISGTADAQRSLCALARDAVKVLHASPDAPRTFRQTMFGLAAWNRFLGAFHSFLAELCEVAEQRGGVVVRPGAVDARLAPILADLAKSPTIGPLPYERWRGRVGIGREQIDRLARQHLGMTLHAWRNRLLEREVRRRLLPGGAVIKAVAAELGFVDSAHFNRWCRQHLHRRPGELRGGAA